MCGRGLGGVIETRHQSETATMIRLADIALDLLHIQEWYRREVMLDGMSQ
jgi:hypothetical protein